MMNLTIDDAGKMLIAVRRARQQCQVRMVQLSHCSVCGAETQEFVDTIELLKQLENQLQQQEESHAVQVQPG